jgi:transcriptional regulator with XRE-family HTH domain
MTTRTTKLGVDAEEYLEKLSGPLTLGRVIRATREGEEMSQQDFAAKLGLSKSHLCDIEKGRKVVSPERAAHFAQALGYPVRLYVQLALQDQLRRGRLAFEVQLQASGKSRRRAA